MKESQEAEELNEQFHKISGKSNELFNHYFYRVQQELGVSTPHEKLYRRMLELITEDARTPGKLKEIKKEYRASHGGGSTFDPDPSIIFVVFMFLAGIGCYFLVMIGLEALSFATVGHPLPRFIYYLPVVGVMGAAKANKSPSFGAFSTGFAISGVVYFLSMVFGC